MLSRIFLLLPLFLGTSVRAAAPSYFPTFGIPESLQWSDSKDVSGLHVSQSVKVSVKPPGGVEGESITRFCILDLGTGKLAQIEFIISKMAPEDTQKYVALSDRMLGTIKVLPKDPKDPTARP